MSPIRPLSRGMGTSASDCRTIAIYEYTKLMFENAFAWPLRHGAAFATDVWQRVTCRDWPVMVLNVVRRRIESRLASLHAPGRERLQL
jgi:hypothetical protein